MTIDKRPTKAHCSTGFANYHHHHRKSLIKPPFELLAMMLSHIEKEH
jgi:hypothetical protein